MAQVVRLVWRHRYVGPAIRIVAAYVVLVELLVQFAFGRLSILGFEVGLQDHAVPRAIFLNGASVGLLYALLGMGLILVYRANRIINFAQAQLGSVPAVTALLLMLRQDVNYFLVLPVVIGGAVLLGAAVEILIIRRFRDAPRLIVTVATIGVSILLLALEFYVQRWIKGDLLSLDKFKTPWTRFGFDVDPLRFSGDFIFAAVVTAIVCVGLTAFFKFTDVGIATRASAENAERAALLGIPVHRVSTIVWVLAAVMSALAVFLRGPMVGLTLGSSIGPSVLLFGLAAAVIARMEHLPTCLAAGMGIGIVDQAALFGTRQSSLAVAVMLLVILVALLAQKGRMARALDAGVSTWQAVREYRPIPQELHRAPQVVVAQACIALAVLTATVVLPLVLDQKYAGRFTIVAITAIVGVSLVILTGWAGQISLGQFGFAGLGAMVAGGAAVRGVDFFVCVTLAGLVGALAAVLVGLPALRIQGPFLAVTTLSFAFTVQYFFLNPTYLGWWLPDSTEFVNRPKLYGFFSTRSDVRFYFVTLAFLVLFVLIARSLRRNRVGRLLVAVRDNARGAQVLGVDLARTKLAAFAISGFMAASAGALLAYYLQTVDPAGFRAERSIDTFALTVIGGLTSVPGALIGASYVEGVPFLFDGDTASRFLTSSVGLLLLLMFIPGGLAELFYRTRDAFLGWVARRNGVDLARFTENSELDRIEIRPLSTDANCDGADVGTGGPPVGVMAEGAHR